MSYRLDRYEFKFLITHQQRDAIISQFPASVIPDRNAGDGAGYRIYSLYFDNPERDCYWEKLRGLRSRRKLRVRLYESTRKASSGACFVEIKHKHDGRGVKRRLHVPLDAAMAIVAGAPSPVPIRPGEERVLTEIQHLIAERKFEPVCCLRYDRRAYFEENSEADLRITFDEDIRYRMDDLSSLQHGAFDHCLIDESHSVMEVKVTGAVPVWLTQVLRKEKCTPAGRSKYCDAIAAGDPVIAKAA